MTPSELRPVGLRCEYRINPLGIDERVPRFSWVLEAEGRGQAQSAYRILVGRSEKDLEWEENLLWDSGRVESGRSVGVEYGGEVLRSGSRCLWKVRVWDRAGEPSSYSGPAVFETGLLEKSDWEGAWISAGKGRQGIRNHPRGKSTMIWPMASPRALTCAGSFPWTNRSAGRASM
jgi:alpha-L-rhamnosidase